jgi:hypothetical protein
MNENLSQLEDKIHSGTKNPKRPLTAVFAMFGIGLALLATGIFLVRNQTSRLLCQLILVLTRMRVI